MAEHAARLKYQALLALSPLKGEHCCRLHCNVPIGTFWEQVPHAVAHFPVQAAHRMECIYAGTVLVPMHELLKHLSALVLFL